MPTRSLTVASVARIKPPKQGQADHFDQGFPGLALRVSYGGQKAWTFFYRLHGGKLRRLTLGHFPAMGLAEARDAWRDAREAVGKGENPVNLFDVVTWQRYDLLRRIGAPVVRRSYYEHVLAPLLRQAEQLLCEIVDFDPAKVADVVYLFGREKTDTTYGWFRLRSGVADSIDRSTNIQGDGTVPTYSAQNFLVSGTRQTVEVAANHTSIISSDPALNLIKEWYAKAMKRADLDTARANPQYQSLLVAETAATGNLIPVSLNAGVWSKGDDRFAIEINTTA